MRLREGVIHDPQGGDSQAGKLSHASALVCHALTPRGLRHSDHPGAAGARGHEHHDDPCACAESERVGGSEPGGFAVTRKDSRGVIWKPDTMLHLLQIMF